LALSVPLSRFTSRVGGGSAFYVRPLHTLMTQDRTIPTPLSVVSYVFLLTGILAAVEIIVGLTRGAFHLNLAILGFWIFFGLRRYSPGWRTCALVFIWIGMIVPSLMFVLLLSLGRLGSVTIFGQRHDGVSPFWILIPVALFFALEFWMYRVLTRPDIRRMFYDVSQTPAA
jgi:hypothetical protein